MLKPFFIGEKYNMSDRIIIIDANNTCFRVGWTNKHLTNKGEPTGVIFGFLKEIIAVWERWKNARIAVVWDGGSKERIRISKKAIKDGVITEEQGYYKQNRERQREKEEESGEINEFIESISIQKPTLKEILDLTLVHQFQIEGLEADDVIGTLAKKHAKKGDSVSIISSDKDMYQLLEENINILSFNSKKGMSYESFCGEYGITPNQWIDIGALAGDKGDNIHGVKGIGEKTAIKILSEAEKDMKSCGKIGYKEIIDWLKNKEKLKKKEENILKSEEIIHLAYNLKKINTNISDLESVCYSRSNPTLFRNWLALLGFGSIINYTGLLTKRSQT